MSEGSPLQVALQIEAQTHRLAFADPGTVTMHPAGCDRHPSPPDLTIVRSAAIHRGDLDGSLEADQIAAGTSIATGAGRSHACWGLPPSVPIDLALASPFTLRLNASSSPFGYRAVGIDLTVDDGHLLTEVASGSADLEVTADWCAALSWLLQPAVLFADAFPDVVKISGEVALLSLFEGALWRATAGLDLQHAPALLRWSQLWPTGRVRRDLHTSMRPG